MPAGEWIPGDVSPYGGISNYYSTVTQPVKDEDKIRKLYQSYIPSEITDVSKSGPIQLQEALKRREEMLKGYSAPELEGMRSQMAGAQQMAQKQKERAMLAALAKQGIRGGAAASMQAQLAQQNAIQQANIEQDLMLKQAQRQKEALGEYQQSVMGSLDQAQKRQLMELATKLQGEQAILGKQGLDALRQMSELWARYNG